LKRKTEGARKGKTGPFRRNERNEMGLLSSKDHSGNMKYVFQANYGQALGKGSALKNEVE